MSSNPHDGSRPTIVLVHSPFAESAMVRTTQAPWCLGVSAWLLPPTKRAPARPWDRQTRKSGASKPGARWISEGMPASFSTPSISSATDSSGAAATFTHLSAMHASYLRLFETATSREFRRELQSTSSLSRLRAFRTTSLCAPGSPANSALALPAGAARHDARTATSRLA